MHYFNGFSLRGEERFFSEYLVKSDFCAAGFSFGAQQAFEYVLGHQKRIDRLILLSPAFFQTQKKNFLRTQLHYFQADQAAYISQFLKNVSYPSSVDLTDLLHVGSKEELESLLSYRWEKEKVMQLLERGVTIEVFLGEQDRIIDLEAAYAFFKPLGVTYFIKGAGHLLLEKEPGNNC
ncbi:pimelyl-ACP methyl ester esterase BioV [Sulfurovum sp.]|uniref:pimelyl-ACP methyl ester esterase BioV n=1 Tax=Sulfurovum sp. TaxID=1969726 RepID=UPI0025F5BF9B|nr:pimelyl-ACP methyl ester esterase BioV [Sulfurovum sp.]